jgi:NifU-like protein
VENGENPDFSPYQFAKKVERVIDEYVRPSLRADGGDLELIDIKGTIIYCRLQGACANCLGASQTLKMMVERILKDQVDERIRVVEV